MYVLRRIDTRPSHGPQWLRLLSLDQFGVGLTLEWSEELPGGAGDVFETLFEVHGRWRGSVGYAIAADWSVALDGNRVAFEESRRELSSLRARHVDAFYAGYLLRRVNDHSHYTALGLYGTRAGLDEARSQAAIAKWVEGNPPAKWGAREVSAAQAFQVAGRGGLFERRGGSRIPS